MYFGQGTGMYYDHMRSGPYEGKTLTNKWGSLTNLDSRFVRMFVVGTSCV